MDRRIPICRRALGLALVVILPGLSASIPVLDMMVGDGHPAVESEHIPGTHGFAHNHLICVQQAANGWTEACPPPLLPMPVFSATHIGLPDVSTPQLTDQISLPHSRAPPTV